MTYCMYAPSHFKRSQHLWKIKGEYHIAGDVILCWRCGEERKREVEEEKKYVRRTR